MFCMMYNFDSLYGAADDSLLRMAGLLVTLVVLQSVLLLQNVSCFSGCWLVQLSC